MFRRALVAIAAVAVASVSLASISALPAQARAGDTLTISIPAAPGSFSTIVTGADGNLWWADGSGNIYRTTVGGTTTTFPAPSSGVHVLAPGPDGNVWYVNRTAGADVVGRVTMAGAITEFPVSGTNRLRTLTAGPDGNMWLLYESSNGSSTPTLAMVTTAGAVTTYIIASSSFAPSIAAGPGGRIWWLPRVSGPIDSIDPSNPTTTLQTYAKPDNTNFASSPNSLLAGTDGNIWTESGGQLDSHLIRLTPGGGMTVFSAQMQHAPVGLVAAPDGNIWFNDRFGELFRLNPDGTQTNFSSAGCACDPMTVGPDGRIWTFDAAGAHLIGVSTGDTSNTVISMASGFSNLDTRLTSFGSPLRFAFVGPASATATDSSGLGLFDTDTQSMGSHYDFTFPYAGTYTYQDTLQPAHTGTVEVPPTADKRYAARCASRCSADIRWSNDVTPVGFTYDVQRQAPGSSSFVDYLIGTTQPSMLEQPGNPGTYFYRARLRRTSDNVATDYSPPVTVQFSNEYASFDGYSTNVSVYRPSDGTWYVHPSSPVCGCDSATLYGGDPSDVPVPGEYDSDPITDIGIYRPSTGLWAIQHSSDHSDNFITYGGIPGDIPIPADYDGDGKTDLAIFRPQFGNWWIHQSSTDSDVEYTFGVAGDTPVVADYDGDGKADIAVFRSGTWYIQQSSDNSMVTVNWGQSGDVPVPGLYDSDAKTDIGVFRPSTGTWFKHPSTDQDSAITYGIPNDIPVVGDYDGDGLADIAVFRPSGGVWYIHYAAPSSSDLVMPWGTSGDIPLPMTPAIRMANFP